MSFVCRGAFAQIKISGDFQSDCKTRTLIISVVHHQNVQLNWIYFEHFMDSCWPSCCSAGGNLHSLCSRDWFVGTGDFSLFCCFLIYFGMDSLVPLLLLLLQLSPFTFLSAVYLSHVCLTFFLTFCLFVWSSKLLASCLLEHFIVRTLTHFGLHSARSFV